MLPANKTANPGLKILVLKTRSLGPLGLIVRIGLLVMMTSTGLANFSDAAHVKAKPAASALSANQAYHSMVLLDGPVGYWRLGDQPGSTTIQDSSTRRTPATVSGPVTFGQPGAVPQDPSTSASFQGSPASFGDIPPAQTGPFRLTNTVSLELWLKTTTTAYNPRLMQFANTVAPYQGYSLGLNTAPNAPVGTIAFWNGTTWTGSHTPVNDGQWHHVVTTFNNGTLNIYRDGTLDTTTSGLNPTLPINPSDDGFGQIDGTIAELAIYPTTLTPTQIASHYEAGRSYYRTVILDDGPVGYWRLGDQPGSTTIQDSSGGGHNASVFGPVVFGLSQGALQDPSTSASFQGSPASFGDIPPAQTGPFRLTNTVSLELWLKTTTSGLNPTLPINPSDDGFGQIDGTIAELAIYPTTLTPTQIALHFQAGGSGVVRRHGSDLVLSDRPISFTGINGPGVPTTAADEGTLDSCTKFTDSFVQSLFQTSPPDQLFRVWFFQAFALTKTIPRTLNWTGMDRLVQWAGQYHQHLDVTLSNQWPDCDSGVPHDLSWYQGGYNQTITKDGNNIMSYASWIQLVLARYGNNPAIAMWEPVNEQNATAADLTCTEPLAAQALASFNSWFVGVARTYSPLKLASSGSGGMGCGSMGGDWVTTQQPFDVWSLHYYDATSPGNAATHAMVLTAGQNSRPLIVGETGISVGMPTGPPCESPTPAARAGLLQSQQTAFFGDGARSVLFWVLDMTQPSPKTCSDYISTADPAFGLLRPG
jgi:hypothetical protein